MNFLSLSEEEWVDLNSQIDRWEDYEYAREYAKEQEDTQRTLEWRQGIEAETN